MSEEIKGRTDYVADTRQAARLKITTIESGFVNDQHVTPEDAPRVAVEIVTSYPQLALMALQQAKSEGNTSLEFLARKSEQFLARARRQAVEFGDFKQVKNFLVDKSKAVVAGSATFYPDELVAKKKIADGYIALASLVPDVGDQKVLLKPVASQE